MRGSFIAWIGGIRRRRDRSSRKGPPLSAGCPRLSLERLEPRSLLTAVASDAVEEFHSHGELEILAPLKGVAASVALSSGSMAAPIGVPALSSRPGAKATLFLDFDGHFESRWGNYSNVVTRPYDLDGNHSTFSPAEISAIREIWSRVSEDYAPFNVNVTTIAPPAIADRVSVRLAIGGNYSDWFGSSAGGVAYVGGFANAASNVGYVFEDALNSGNARFTAEATSHEAGHLFGLSHQAEWSGGRLVTEYNSGTADWAPIMGVGYYADRTTWTRGPLSHSAASVQDDLSQLTGASGISYVPDDFGSTASAASALPVSNSKVNTTGLIGRNDDRDVFKFTTKGGAINFTLNVAPQGANLDGVLELLNASGKSVALSNPSGTLGASLATAVGAGTYYLVARSSGGYGNLGRYTLQGNLPTATTSSPAPPPPPPSTSYNSPLTPTTRILDNGSTTFSATGAWQKAAGVGYADDTHWAAAGAGSSAQWTATGLAPGQYRVSAAWPGSQLNSSAAQFSIANGTQVLKKVSVNQQRSASTFVDAGGQWQSLGIINVSSGSLVVRLASAVDGRVIADAIRIERIPTTSGGTSLEQAVAFLDAEGLHTSPTLLTSSATERSGTTSANLQALGWADAVRLEPFALLVRALSEKSELLPSSDDQGPLDSSAADDLFAMTSDWNRLLCPAA